jgi:importin subunit beta-1
MAAPPATAPLDLTPVLVAAQSPDAGVRQAAEAQLTALRASNPPAFLHALAAELAAEAKPAEARQIAGLILKNALDAPSESKKVRGAQWWWGGGLGR